MIRSFSTASLAALDMVEGDRSPFSLPRFHSAGAERVDGGKMTDPPNEDGSVRSLPRVADMLGAEPEGLKET